MNEEELRQRVGKLRNVPEQSWAYLSRQGYVEEALDRGTDEEAVEYFIKNFDELRAASPEPTSWTQRRDDGDDDPDREVIRGSLSDSDREREAAVEEYLAMCAACDGATRQFRKRVLGDRLLTAEEARALVKSPAARFFDETDFDYAGGEIPLVGHRATLVGHTRERGNGWEVYYRSQVTVEPPGSTRNVEDFEYEPPWEETRRSGAIDRKYGGGGLELFFVNERGRARRRAVWRRSPLERLCHLSERLAKRYRWEPAQSTMFVLTGKPPRTPALRAMTSLQFSPQHLGATITVEASPWVSSKAVERLFCKAQIQVMGTSGGRPPGQKNLKLFRFVAERIEIADRSETDEKPPTPSADVIVAPDNMEHPCDLKTHDGKVIVDEWNKAYPEWAYKTSAGDLNTRLFWRDYNRIKRTIAVGPPYQRPERAN